MVKTIKIKIIPTKDNEIEHKEIIKIIPDMQYVTKRALNKSIEFLYDETLKDFAYKAAGKEIPSDKERFEGVTRRGFIYRMCTDIMEGCSSHICAATQAKAMDQFKKDKQKGLLKGDCSLSNFKQNAPIYLTSDAVNLTEKSGKFIVDITAFNRSVVKNNGYKNKAGKPTILMVG